MKPRSIKSSEIQNKKHPKKSEIATKSPLMSGMTLLIILLCIIVFSPIFNNGFTNWDDPTYIENNHLIKDLSGENISKIFSEPYFSNYQPIHLLSYAIEYHFFQLNPAGYHIVSLIMHLIVVLLIIQLSFILVKEKWVAYTSGLLFALHPMHVESVAWASERKDLLYAIFFFTALIYYCYYLQKRENKFLYLTFFFFLLSAFSKAMAASFPLALIAYDLFYKRKDIKRLVLEKIPFLLVAVIFGFISYSISSSDGSIAGTDRFSLLDRFFYASGNLLMYCIKLLVPFKLSAYYPYPDKESSIMIFYYCAPLIIAIVLFLIIRNKEKMPLLFFSAAFFVATIILVLQLIPVGPTVFSERYSYIPSFSFFLFLSFYFIKFFSLPKFKQPLLICGIAYVVLISFTTFQRNKIWNNSLALWNNVIDQFPRALHAVNNRADAYFKQNNFNEAIVDFTSAIEIDPSYAEAYYNRGNAYGIIGEMDNAFSDFNQAIMLDQNYAEAYNRRAQVFASQGKINEAIEDFKKASQLDDNPEFMYSLAITYLNIGQKEQACMILSTQKQLQHPPSFDLFQQACR